MTFVAVAVIGTVGALGAAGIAAATRPKAPGSPDYAEATVAGIQADIAWLPRRKEIEAKALMGGDVLKDNYTSRKISAGGEEAAAALAKYKAAIPVAEQNITDLEKKLESKTASASMLKTWRDQLNSAKDQKAAAERAILNYDNALKGGGEQTLYFDPQGNVVSRESAISASFDGISTIDQSVAAARAQLDFMDETAQAQYDLQQKFGSQFIDQQLEFLKQSDPIGFQMREDMGRKILSEGFGTNLSPSQTQEVQQAARAGQSARGNIFGAAPAAAEAMQVGDAGYRLQQQRLANASSFIQGTTPQAQFGQISNASQGAAPQGSFNLLNGLSVNPNAGAQSAQFAQNNYNQQSQNWATGLANDPWQSLLGSVTQIGTQAAAQGIFGNASQTRYPNNNPAAW